MAVISIYKQPQKPGVDMGSSCGSIQLRVPDLITRLNQDLIYIYILHARDVYACIFICTKMYIHFYLMNI